MQPPFDHPLPGLSPAWQVVIGTVLGVAGVACLLPRPRHRQIAVGTFLVLAAGVVLGLFAATTFGGPGKDTVHDRIYAGLFWLFASVAVGFAVVMVAQRNPARGAMAFAVSVLATCGLFLLLAAPFLMAATVVVYAGATIVTFLFVLMLSHAGGPSDENDRTREPLLGSLGGLGFAGLVLFTLYLGSPARATDPYPLPAPPVTAEEAAALRSAAATLRTAAPTGREVREALARIDEATIAMSARLKPAADPRTRQIAARADALRDAARPAGNLSAVADEAIILSGRGDLPARNVAAIGYSLYSEHLLAVELAGTLLLVATVGAVAVAGRRKPA